MVGSINKVVLIGNLGKDPEIRHSADGNKIVSFPVATSESWKDKSGERQEKTEWHRCVIFSQGLADVVERYVKKGTKVYIEGQIRTRKWQDASGVEKYTTEVVLSNFNSTLIILDRQQGGSSDFDGGSSSPKATGGTTGSDVSLDSIDDEIPF